MATIGGRLIDQGNSGCIFTPALHCKYKKHDQKPIKGEQIVTKLIHKDDANQEYTISMIIREIPLWRNYFSVALSMCVPSTKQTEKDLSECKPLDKAPISTFRILPVPYAGLQIFRYKFSAKTFDMMNFFTHLIGAGALLALFGVVHTDLHMGNILVDHHGIPRIIDFNLAIIKEKVTINRIEHAYGVIWSQESPDATLINAIAHGYTPSNAIPSIILKKPIMKKIRSMLSITNETMIEQLEQFAATSASITSGNVLGWFKNYWCKIDSWAIGVIIVYLLSSFSVMSEFTPMIMKHKPRLIPLLRRMCAINPIQRIDCVQALYYLQPDHFIIRKYGKKWLEDVGSGNIVATSGTS
jgi:serine/threonine protein kinase